MQSKKVRTSRQSLLERWREKGSVRQLDRNQAVAEARITLEIWLGTHGLR